ncbi:hypothetical protein F5884DRAFT_833070 [Xylogone sp. PMI_703]|nr:hypothetical protein F5884DRAFT_833070 [Xylogone sp. PMI_703]
MISIMDISRDGKWTLHSLMISFINSNLWLGNLYPMSLVWILQHADFLTGARELHQNCVSEICVWQQKTIMSSNKSYDSWKYSHSRSTTPVMVGQKKSNVLIISNDLSFRDTSPFGDEINMSNIYKLATEDLQMHNVASFLPTGAILLSRIDAHISGIGAMTE